MTVYSLVLFIHVVSAIGLFIAFALEGFVSLRIGWSQSADEMRFFLGAIERLKWIAIPSFAGILLGGFYLAYPYPYESTFWIPAALVATLAIMAIGGLVTGRKRIQLTRALGKGEAAFDALAARAKDKSLAVSYGLRVGLALAIVFLMTTQPGVWPSVIALVAGLVAGLLIAAGFEKISKRAGAGCGPMWHRTLEETTAPSSR